MIDDEIRTALRNGDDAKAIRLQARLGSVAEQSKESVYQWRSLDGRLLHLHEITDAHLDGIIKLKIRRYVRAWRIVGQGRVIPRGRRLDDPEILRHVFQNFAARDKTGILLGEADRRNMPRRGWIDYLLAVIERRCDDCGKRRHPPRLVFERGPADLLQCQSCARTYELRCPRCDKPNTGALGDGRDIPGLGSNRERPREDLWRGALCGGCKVQISWVPKKPRKAT